MRDGVVIPCGEGFCPESAGMCCPNQGGCCLENELCTDEMPPRCLPKPALNVTLCSNMPCDAVSSMTERRGEEG